MNFRHLISPLLLAPLVAVAAPVVTNTTPGDVGTTAFSLCWETGEPARAGVEVFSDAGGTSEITAGLRVEHQFLTDRRREVATTAASRSEARALQAGMDARGVFLSRISGLQPDTTYWVRALALDPGGATLATGPLVEVTTARDSTFIVESRQLVVDFSAAAALLGDLGGAVVRLENAGSAHPLFAVINDSLGGNRCYFDLNHLLDASGEVPLNPASGTTLTLDLALLGMPAANGIYTGNEVAYDGSPLTARSSTAIFEPESFRLVALAADDTALSGQVFTIDLRATDSSGTPLADFDRALVLESPAINGGSLTTAPLVDGQLDGHPLVLTTLGNQTVTVRDPDTGATTTLVLEVLAYSYDNFRLHYYGDLVSPEGEASGNGDGDPYGNLFEFAHGLNPRLLDRPLALTAGGGLARRGGPLVRIDTQAGDFGITFLRAKNHQALGLHYTPQMSAALQQWFDTATPPTVLEDDGEMELVTVRFPFFTPDFKKPRFFRLEVTLD